MLFYTEEEEKEEEIYLPRTTTILNKKNTILMLARSRLPEKQKPSMLAANIVNTLTLIQKNQLAYIDCMADGAVNIL